MHLFEIRFSFDLFKIIKYEERGEDQYSDGVEHPALKHDNEIVKYHME